MDYANTVEINKTQECEQINIGTPDHPFILVIPLSTSRGDRSKILKRWIPEKQGTFWEMEV